ncbi:MAG: TolC family outer membrane protein [Sphingorhabdus sp.]|nr:TolC family outer membrane protein [Sphingorhabdus sp.]
MNKSIKAKLMLATPAALLFAISGTAHAQSVDLKSAVELAVESHPEINQAAMNKEAIEFEREQAQGLFLPRITVEGSVGVRRLENPTRRALGIADNELYPMEAGIRGEQILFDSGNRSNELKRQAARTDGAAYRVDERSQFIALQVSRQYLDYLLQQRIVAASQDNVAFHNNLVNDLREGVTKGSISIADQQQAEERLQAAMARLTEAEQDMINTGIAFRTLTGVDIDATATLPPSLRANLPASLPEAIEKVRLQSPRVREAQADLDAAHAVIGKAKADLGPTISLEGNARIGDDIDGFRGETNDLQARVVARWLIFDGGINRAKVQEMVRRASEVRFRLHQLTREAEEDVRVSWNAWTSQGKLAGELDRQAKVSDDLLLSYREQFNVGRRSLLDVLDAQNTRYNVQVRAETARFAETFAEYKILAAANELMQALGVGARPDAEANARERFKVGPTPPAETDRRRYSN